MSSAQSQPRWRQTASVARPPRTVAVVILAALGVAVSAYLTWVHYGDLPLFCSGVSGCETVQASRFATIGALPVAQLGLGLYLLLLVLGAWRLWAGPATPTLVPLAIFGLTLAGFLYSAYLTYLELFVIYAICLWCVGSALLLTALFGLATRDVLLADSVDPR